jgi:hypothetical protein
LDNGIVSKMENAALMVATWKLQHGYMRYAIRDTLTIALSAATFPTFHLPLSLEASGFGMRREEGTDVGETDKNSDGESEELIEDVRVAYLPAKTLSPM